MKKILAILLLISGASQLKAQQSTSKSVDSTLFKTPNFKLNDTMAFKNYFSMPQQNQFDLLKGPGKSGNSSDLFYSTMPVLKTGSDDKMPIAKLGKSNMNYTMLVKKIKVVNPFAKATMVNP